VQYVYPSLRVAGALQVTDGMTAPTTLAGSALLYVDTADGDLKVKFGDGATRVVCSDATLADYTVTNAAAVRTMDASTISAADLADVVGTLITDLIARGVLQ
jgi:hypothetical protein